MKTNRRSQLAAILAATFFFSPHAALACSVCTGGQKAEVQWAMLRGSVILSILPLAAVGGGAWFVRRRARALAAIAEARASQAPASAPSSASTLASPRYTA